MNKIKILHVIPALKKGGAERLALDICNELNKREQVEVRMLHFNDTNEYVYLSANLNRTVIDAKVIPSLLGEDTFELSAYLEYINSFKPDIIHSHLFETEMITRQALFSNAKYVTHLHDNMPQFRNLSLDTFFNKQKITNWYEKSMMLKQYRKCNNNFIAISADNNNFFRKSLPKDLDRITLMSNAIDIKRFKGDESGRTPIKIHEQIKLVTVGNLVPIKNQQFLIEIVNLLVKHKIDVHLDILGDGPERANIQAKTDKAGLNNRIRIHGFVDQVEEFLSDAHIYLHAAKYEAFGLVFLEAMASGLPCVSLDGKGNRDIIMNGENGVILKDQNPQIFANKVIELISSPELYQKISKNAQSTAMEYGMKEYVDNLLKYYYQLLGV